MTPSQVLYITAGSTLLIGAAALAQPGPVIMPVPTGNGDAIFRIKSPTTPTSWADRVNLDLGNKEGDVPPNTPGYLLTNRLIIRSDDAAAVMAAGHSAQLEITPHESVPGFWIATSDSVMDAIIAATDLGGRDGLAEVYLEMAAPRPVRSECDLTPADPGLGYQWHLLNNANPSADLNVEPVWCEGYTGAGTIIGIIEDGFQLNHPDLISNFVTAASMSGAGASASHATSVAGLAAAVEGNGRGGVGVAFNAGLSNLFLGSSNQNASAFTYRNDLNDVKVAAWGPPDNGWITYMTSLERAALELSANDGRSGHGEVFSWAAGNGGLGDRVDYDPYASSRFTLAIGAIGDHDTRAYYNEVGSSMFAVAPSSGNNRNIYTTKSGNGYTNAFGGTSASAPQVAGVVALMMEANPSLSWRDVQHILAYTARFVDPNASWTLNGAGIPISYDYGFGAIDAHEAVELAKYWEGIDDPRTIDTGFVSVNATLPDGSPVGVIRPSMIVDDLLVESVELMMTVESTFVGDLRIELISPSGTSSLLSEPRFDPQDNLTNYVFTTFRNWGESAKGQWQIRVADEISLDGATWVNYRLKIHGSSLQCAPDFNDDGLVNTGDFIAFLNAFTSAHPAADFNGDGLINTSDFIAFLNAFVEGC